MTGEYVFDAEAIDRSRGDDRSGATNVVYGLTVSDSFPVDPHTGVGGADARCRA